MKIKRLKERNPLYDHPLMRKGGVHEKSDKTKRRIAKQKLKICEWYEQSFHRILFMPFTKGQVA